MKPAIALWMAAGACLWAQNPPATTVGRVYDSQLNSTEREVVSLAEAMPASDTTSRSVLFSCES